MRCFRSRPVLAEHICQQPKQISENQERHRQMNRQPILADIVPVDKTAFHHPPSDAPLRGTQKQQQGEMKFHPVRQLAPPQKPEKRHAVDQPDQTAPQTVNIFPPEDRLEFGERHTRILQAIFRRLLVEVEDAFPFSSGKWRERADQRPPFNHRQTRFRKAGNRAYQHHQRDHRHTGNEPDRQRARISKGTEFT